MRKASPGFFSNPGLDGKPFITNTLFAAYSLYNPGEQAPVHRHTPSASRFVLEGDGGFTVVEGEKLPMERGDLILTPNGTWHDHGNDGTEPVIWVDVLNVPLVEALNGTVFEFNYTERDPLTNTGEPVPRNVQSLQVPIGHSQALYGTGGIKPLFVDHDRGITAHSPKFIYKWADTKRALECMSNYKGSPYDGIIIEYIDPTTGNPVMPAMSYRAQMLRAGEHTLSHRRMASTIYCVLDGEGYTEVEGQRFDWSRNDVFTIPGWRWHEHHNTGASGAFLYSVTDEPAMRLLGLYRHERKDNHGQISLVLN